MTKYDQEAVQVLEELESYGATLYRIGNSVGVNFASARIKKGNHVRLWRTIRKAALLERTGALRADIDRMGEVVGWHRTSLAKSPEKGDKPC